MARIGLAEGFRNLHEGSRQRMTITDVEYEPKFGKTRVRFEDEDHGSGFETYTLGKATLPDSKLTTQNKGARNAFATMAKCALGDWEREDIDTDELVGRTVICDVVKTPVENKETGEVKYYTHLRNFAIDEEAEGAAEEEDEELFG